MTKTTRVPVSHDAPATRQRPVSQWTGFGSLRDEVERLFDSFEPRLWFDRGSGRTALTGLDMPLCPAIDLTETETGYAITAELPGLNADDITIKTTDGTLSISGEKAEEKEEKEATYHMRERRWGSFQRTVRMPANVDHDKIEASFDKGVLNVSLPKTEAARASERTVPVKAA